MSEQHIAPAPTGAPALAITMAVFAVGSVAALTYHPVSRSISDLAASALQNRLVHGFIIALLLVQVSALAAFSVRIGIDRFAVRSAMIAFGFGAVAAIGAMLMDGFISSDLSARYADATAQQTEALRPVLRMLGIAIQVLTKLFLLLTSASIVLWSFELFHRVGAARLFGALGLVIGLAVAGAMLFLEIRLSPHTLMPLMGAHSMWFLAIAGMLLTGRL